MVTFYFRKNNNLDVLLNISFCRIPLSLLWARKCLHCALIFLLLARHAIFCWVHLSTQSLLAILLKLAHCKPQPFTQEKTYGGMLGDKPARWQQAVLAERYKGRGDREKGRERGLFECFYSSVGEFNSELPQLKQDLLAIVSMCEGQRTAQKWQGPINILAAFLTYIWTLQDIAGLCVEKLLPLQMSFKEQFTQKWRFCYHLLTDFLFSVEPLHNKNSQFDLCVIFKVFHSFRGFCTG